MDVAELLTTVNRLLAVAELKNTLNCFRLWFCKITWSMIVAEPNSMEMRVEVFELNPLVEYFLRGFLSNNRPVESEEELTFI